MRDRDGDQPYIRKERNSTSGPRSVGCEQLQTVLLYKMCLLDMSSRDVLAHEDRARDAAKRWTACTRAVRHEECPCRWLPHDRRHAQSTISSSCTINAFILALWRFISRPTMRRRTPVGCGSYRAINRGGIVEPIFLHGSGASQTRPRWFNHLQTFPRLSPAIRPNTARRKASIAARDASRARRR